MKGRSKTNNTASCIGMSAMEPLFRILESLPTIHTHGGITLSIFGYVESFCMFYCTSSLLHYDIGSLETGPWLRLPAISPHTHWIAKYSAFAHPPLMVRVGDLGLGFYRVRVRTYGYWLKVRDWFGTSG